MSVTTDAVARRLINVQAGVPYSIPLPALIASSITVTYGQDGLPAVAGADFDVVLGDDFNTFSITFTPGLIEKMTLNGQGNEITARRNTRATTEATPAVSSQTTFVSREFDLIAMRDAEMNERMNRSLVLGPQFVGDAPLLRLDGIAPGRAIVGNQDGTALVPGPNVGDLANAEQYAESIASDREAVAADRAAVQALVDEIDNSVASSEFEVLSKVAAVAGPGTLEAAAMLARFQNVAPTIWSRIERVNPEWGGARTDGTEWAATRAALQAAADFSAREGKVLLLDGAYGIGSVLTLPDHLRLEARSDSYITPRFNAGVGNAAVVVGEGVTADRLAVNILDLAYTGQAVRVNGGAEIGSISCLANASISTSDAALIVTGAHSRIGQVVVENFFTGWIVTEAEDVVIEGDSLKGVRAGVRFEFCKNVHLRGGRVEMLTRTVRTLGDLGFMGVGLRGCSVSDRTVYDCGEHAFRLGGGGTYDELVAAGMSSAAAIEKCRNEGFALRDCRAVRPLGCGFKSQPNEVVRNTDLSISGLITEDVDNGLGGDANSSAIRLTNTDHVSIVGFQNRTKGRAYSGTRGLSVEGCDHVHAEGMLGTPSQTGLFVTTSIPEGGSRGITDMRFRVRVTGSQGEGVRVNVVDNANQIRRMTLDLEVINSAGSGLVFNARPDGSSPTTTSSMVHLKGYLVGNAPNTNFAAIYAGVGRFRDDTVKI